MVHARQEPRASVGGGGQAVGRQSPLDGTREAGASRERRWRWAGRRQAESARMVHARQEPRASVGGGQAVGGQSLLDGTREAGASRELCLAQA